MRTLLAVVAPLAFLAGCSPDISTARAAVPAPIQRAPATAPSPPPPAAPAALPARVVTETISFAGFGKGDRLEACVDVDWTWNVPGELTDWVPRHRAGTHENEAMLRLRRPCPEQFAELTPLATCTQTYQREADDSGVSGTATGVARYYLYSDVFESNASAHQCLADGGDWQAVTQDSAPARQAQALQSAGQRAAASLAMRPNPSTRW
jgi:hypothetical protein